MRCAKADRRHLSLLNTFKRSPLPWVIGWVLSGQAMAAPEGEEVVAGAASVSRAGNATVINQATDRLAMNWQSFDVNSDERVQFIQPSSSSVALNRILSNTASHINGRVDANGQLIFVNPHGILFGQHAVINAGGILASGLSIDPDDFINGNYTFSALEHTDGVVINQGLLHAATGGSVSLLGKKVQNEGLISARLGSVNFAAGREAVVTFDNQGQVGVRISQALLADEIGVDPAVVNAGDIQAEGGKVLLTASASQDIFSQAVNRGDLDYNRSVVVNDDGSFTIGEGADIDNSGDISVAGASGGDIVLVGENITHSGTANADSTVTDGGHIEIHSRDTTWLTDDSVVSADASYGKGGDIKLLGERVGLMDAARVNAAGFREGGQVLVGGDYRGNNPHMRNASAVYMGENTQINVEALATAGQGGRVILWGNDVLNAFGAVRATGGLVGGFVETSAGVVNLGLTVDVSSDSGAHGTWLIDPYNITITDDGTPPVLDDDTDENYDTVFTGNQDNSVLTISNLRTSLAGGANVLVETSGTGDQQGDITLASELSINDLGNNSLTLRAHDDIFINAKIFDGNLNFGSDSLNLTLISNFENGGWDDAATPAPDPAAGNIVIANGVSISTYGGNFSASGSNFIAGNGSVINTGGGNFLIGDEANPSGSFDSHLGEINVASNSGGGDVRIYLTGDAHLGHIQIGDANTGSPENATSTLLIDATNIALSGDGTDSTDDLIFAVDGSDGNHTVDMTLNAAGNITVSNFQSDNGNNTSSNRLNVTLNAGQESGVITFTGTDTLWLGGGNFVATGHDFVLNTAQIGAEGGDIVIGTDVLPLTGDFLGSNGNIDVTRGTDTGNIAIRALGDVALGYLVHGVFPDVASSGSDFSLYVSAGDDISINQEININTLVGTGSNSLVFLANNALENDASTADPTRVDGIDVRAPITTDGTNNDLVSIVFGSSAGRSNFANTAAIDSGGGEINIAVGGDIRIQGAISTEGGDFFVGKTFTLDATDYTNYANSFDNYGDGSTGGAIDTDGGAITITTIVDATENGDVHLGNLDNSDQDRLSGDITVVSGNNITLEAEYDYDNTGRGDTGEATIFTTLSLTADNDITIAGTIRDSSSGQLDTLDIILNAGQQAGSGTGDVIVNANIYTDGGNFTASGVNFNSTSGQINTRDANNSGGGTTGNDGDITLSMTGAVTLGNVRTEDLGDGGNLSIAADGLVTQASGTTLAINGTTELSSGSTGNIIFANVNNLFDKAITVNTAQDVTLYNDSVEGTGTVIFNSVGDLTVDDNGAVELRGSGSTPTISGNLSVTALGNITDLSGFTVVGTSTFDAGAGSILLDANSDYQGAVSVESASALSLLDALGNLVLGNISINGTGAANSITALAGNVTHADTDSNTITIAASGANTGSLTISGESLSLGNIDTAGANDYQGGAVNLSASTGTISVGTITTRGGEGITEKSNTESINTHGGNVTLSAETGISVGAIDAEGGRGRDSDNSGINETDGGDGGTVSLTSVSGSITTAGISTDGGNGHALEGGFVADNDDADGGNAGSITITTSGDSIVLGGDVTARGGRLWDDGQDTTHHANGAGNAIRFNGNVVLADADIVVDNTLTEALAEYPAANVVESAIADVIVFAGTLDGTTAGAGNLTIKGANIRFDGNIGATASIGNLIIGERDTNITSVLGPLANEVNAATHSLFARSVLVTASAFIAGNITTTGLADSDGGVVDIQSQNRITTGAVTANGGTASAAGQAGGSVTLSAGSTLNFGDISTSGSDSTTTTGGQAGNITLTAQSITGGSLMAAGGDGVTTGGQAGGISLAAQDISVGALVAAGGDGVTAGGDGGAVSVVATHANGTPSIVVSGDVNTEGGAGTAGGNTTVAQLSLAGGGTTVGRVEFQHSAFFTSSFTVTGNSANNATDTITGLPVESFWVSSADGAGKINNAASSPTVSVSFSGFEKLQGNDAVDHFSLAHNFAGVSGGRDADIFTVTADITGQLLGEGGNDLFKLEAGVDDGDATTLWDVFGGTGDDTFEIFAGISKTTIDGGDDTDTLALLDADTTTSYKWKLTAADSGTLGNIQFTAIEQINGSDGGNDRFEFNGFTGSYGGVNGGIDGRGGDEDSWLVASAGTYEITLGDGLQGLTNVELFEGGGAGFILQLATNASPSGIQNTWTIDGTNSGTVTDGTHTFSFKNFANLQGNEARDYFDITTGSIVGVSGIRAGGSLAAGEINTFALNNGTHTWALSGDQQGSVSGMLFASIQALSGAGADTLEARAQANTWTLDTENSLAATGSDSATGVTFSGMARLEGNSQTDQFVINASVAMMLDGGDGDDLFRFGTAGAVTAAGGISGGDAASDAGDRIIGRDSANTWSLSDSGNSLAETGGSVYVTTFEGIETLQGSDSAADIFDFANIANYRLIGGSSGGDTADYADVVGTLDLEANALTLSGIDRLVGNQNGLDSPASNNSTLTYVSASGSSVDWLITDFDAGDNLADGINDGTVNGIEFVNFNNLTGSDGNDSFTFDATPGAVAGVTGMLTGGGDTGVGDQIFSSNVDTTWKVAPLAGDASLTYANGRTDSPLETTTTFTGFETLNAGSGNDEFTVGRTTTISLNAGAGVDTVILPDEDLSITLGNSINGLSLSGFETLQAFANRNNQLTVISANNVNVNWDIHSANAGAVTVGSAGAVNFENFQVLIGGDGNDTFDFSNGGSVVRTGSANGAVSGAGGNNRLVGRAVDTGWTINGNGSGYLSAGTLRYVEEFTGIQTLEGHSTNDTFTITDEGTFTGTLVGNGGGDSLSLASVSGERNEWRLLESGSLDRVQRLTAGDNVTSSISFSGIDNLTGGTGVDDFIFLGDGPYAGAIDAGTGSGVVDSVDLSRLTTVSVALSTAGVYGVANVERVVGNGANSTLSGLDSGTNTWGIGSTDGGQAIAGANGANDGVLANGADRVQFVNFARLQGGDNATDEFTLALNGSITGSINGGSDASGTLQDSLIAVANNRTWTMSAAGAGQVNNSRFTGIERVESQGDGDTLIGFNQNNTWTVTGSNRGTLAETSGANTLSFVGMENLAGNLGNDDFVLVDNASGEDGQVSGNIYGTAPALTDRGADTLTLQSAAGQQVNWSLSGNSGETLAVVAGRFAQASRLESMTGGNGQDIFTLADALVTVTLDGAGATTDQLVIGHGSATVWQISRATDPDSVSVLGEGTVEFAGIEIAEGSNTAADTFNVVGNGSSLVELRGRGGDDLVVLDTTTDSDIHLRFVAGDGNDELVAGDRNNTWQIAGSGNNAYTLNHVSTNARGLVFDSSLEILTGGIGEDDFAIGTTSPLNIRVNGGGGADTLFAANRSNSWIIGGAGFTANTLNAVDAGNRGVVFSAIENFIGNAGQDTFSVLSGSIGGAVVGGGGAADSLTVNRSDVASTTQWQITGSNQGTVDGIAGGFSEIEHLTGGDRADAFTVAATGSVSGMLRGGGGTAQDSLDVSAFTDGVAVELTDSVTPANNIAGVQNLHVNSVERIVAAADPDVTDSNDTEAGNWLLNSLAGNYRWSVDGRNQGQIASDPEAMPAVNFAHFGNLQAGEGDDTFAFVGTGAISGNFDGGGTGNDTADFSQVNGDVVIVLNDPNAAIQFSAIEQVVGNNNGSTAGNSNTTTISVASGTTNWTVNGLNRGRVDTAGVDLDFAGVNFLLGGSGLDTFNLTTGTAWISGGLDGGAASAGTNPVDAVDARNLSGNFTARLNGSDFGKLNLFNIERIQANGANNALEAAPTGSHVWEISQANGGTVTGGLQFSGFDTLIGNEQNDTFNLAIGASLNAVQGAGGMDRLSVASTAETSPSSSNYTQWAISGSNAGTVFGRVNTFNDVEHLTGGAGQDAFVFTSFTASLTGLINGGESGQLEDVNIDKLDVSVFSDGVVVELGSELSLGTIVEGTDALANVNAYNVEDIKASKDNENANWLALNHDRDVVLRMTSTNTGYVQDGTSIDALVANTRVDFAHFGSLQGGGGDMDDNMVAGSNPNPTGDVREGSGRRSRNFSAVDGLVVVDITPNLVSVTGNDNTLLRVANSDPNNPDGNFNGVNTWLITGNNAGTFNATYLSYTLEFSGINQLQGGAQNDDFQFVADAASGTHGALIDGFINGGGGSNTINITTANSDLIFGVNRVQTTATVPVLRYPEASTQPVFLMDNRDGVIDIANISQVNDTDSATGRTRMMSSDTGSAEWRLDSVNGYQLVDNTATVDFAGVAQVLGGAANDRFNVIQLGSLSEVIDGGAGDDTLNLASLAGVQHVSLDADDAGAVDFVIANMETLQTNTLVSGHRLSGDDTNTTWTLNRLNGGSLTFQNASGSTQTLAFDNIAHLQGGDAQDVFELALAGNLTGTLHGGGQGATADEVRVLDTSTQTFVFQQTTVAGDGQAVDMAETQIDLAGIERLTANNGLAHSLVGGADIENTFTVTAAQNSLVNSRGTLLFSGIANLSGGNQRDTFTFDGAAVTGLVDGGANPAGVADAVTLRNVASAGVTAVHLGSPTNAGQLHLAGIEQVSAQTAADNLRLIGANTANTWMIQGTNAGTVNNIGFTGLAHLVGGTAADTFVLARQANASEDDRITGSIDGGTGSALDRVDITGVVDSVTVSLDPEYAAYLTLANVEQLAATDNNHVLVGGNAATQTWSVTGENEGALGAMSFAGFANLLGRDRVDIFNFSQTGSVTGRVDGGGQPAGGRDLVDMSELAVANVVIGDTSAGFDNIEAYIGNNNSSTITAADVRNSWTINGENAGEIQDQNGNDIAFSGFTSLVGGSSVDEFTLAGGSISGGINAGGGQDRLNVDLATGLNGRVNFNGGGDDDVVFITGGDVNNRFTASYSPASANENETFSYDITQGEDAFSFDVVLAATETVNNRVYTSVLTVNDVDAAADVITLANNRVDIAGVRTINLANNEGFRVLAEQGDSVVIDGQLALDNSFSVTNAAVSGSDQNAGVNALGGISFIATGPVGSAENALAIATPRLALTGVRGDVFLNQEGDLTITALSNPAGQVVIDASGSITSSGNFTSSQAVQLSSDGDITLNGNHALSGLVSLLAEAGDVVLSNGTTLLGDVRAQNLTLTTSGGIDDQGTIQVANQTTINGADTSVVTLDNAANRFESVLVQNAGTLVLRDSSENGVVVGGTTTNEFSVAATNGITSNAINAGSVDFSSGAGVLIQDAITAANAVVVNAQGINVNSAITVASAAAEQAINLAAGDGNLNIRGALLADGAVAGDVVLQGDAIAQFLGAEIRGVNVLLNSANAITLGADIAAQQNLTATAGGALTMDGGSGLVRAEAENLSFTAGTGIVAEELVANTLSLHALNGNIVQLGNIESNGVSIAADAGNYVNSLNTTTRFGQAGMTVNAQNIELSGILESTTGNLTASAEQALAVTGSVSAVDLNLTAGGQIGMTSAASIAATTNAQLQAGTDLLLSRIAALESVSLTAGGAITDNNGSQVNIVSDALFARSGTGFGGLEQEASIDVSVANIDVMNAAGNIGLINDRDVSITALISNGDITMVNTQGNVVLTNNAEVDYDRSATLAEDAGGVINSNYDFGRVTLHIQDGYLNATPAPNFRRPELVGDIVEVSTTEGFGVGRQLVVYARTELIVGGPGIRPIWGYNKAPKNGLTTDSDLVVPVSGSGDLLIEIEEMEYIDPAVFTNVRNFAYGDVPIRMPRDQLYDDEILDEDDDETYY